VVSAERVLANSGGMTFQSLLQIVLAVALLVWICVRQLMWSPVNPRRMWRTPLVLTAAGVVSLVSAHVSVTPLDIGFLVIEAVVAAGAGSAMGMMARFRPVTEKTQRRPAAGSRQPEEPIITESRTGWAGTGLWLVLLAVRVGLGVISHNLGLQLVSATGVIFLAVAVNRAARTVVLASRLDRHSVLTPGSPSGSLDEHLGVSTALVR
jgi:hypothetical protein